LGHYLRYESTLLPMIRELAIMTMARQFDCQYEWTSHEPLARQAGVRNEAITALRDREAPQGLTEEEAMIVRFGQELVRNRGVSDATFQGVVKCLGQQGNTELTTTMGYYTTLGFALNAFDVQPEEPLLSVEYHRSARAFRSSELGRSAASSGGGYCQRLQRTSIVQV
jgi:4-carboxymuconolactone decarboxylase